MKVLELKGFKSLKALNVFHSLMLGLKMLPAYQSESYEDFFARIELMSSDDQEKMIREAALFVKLDKDEVESLICFVTDANGVPYQESNLGNLGPDEIYECIVAVCKKISQIKINLVSGDEKKNSV